MIREMRANGVLPVLGFLLSALGFILASVAVFRKIPSTAVFIYPFGAIAICLLLNEREKSELLQSAFTGPRFAALRAMENAIVAVPFSIFLMARGHFGVAAGTVILCAAFSLFRIRRTISFQIPSPFGNRPYEFSTGFRRNFLFVLLLYAVSVIALFSHNYNLGLVLLFGMALLAAMFYSHLDPMYYVWIFSLSGKEFLWKKAETGLLYGFFIMSPVFLPLAVMYPHKILLSLMVILVGLLVIVLAILAAYVNFPSRLTMMDQIKFLIGMFFPPALLYVIPDFYFRALERLKVFLKC